ncbi:MAG: DnaD domain protein [Anaerolineae bacterium]|nr:DnaD domain protein [Anaerolineae bacterium]
MARFTGFRATSSRMFSLPAAFVDDLLPLVDHLGELQVTLFCMYAVQQREGQFRYLLRADMANSSALLAALAAACPTLPPQEALDDALDRAIGRGSLLVAQVATAEDGEAVTLYFVNGPAGRTAIEQIARGGWRPGDDGRPVDILPERPTIYRLYEENIGPLTPMIAESLKDAELEYSAVWVADAIRIAVEQNARSWRYVQSVLERWRKEGRTPHETAPGSDEQDGQRFVRGKYAGFIEH